MLRRGGEGRDGEPPAALVERRRRAGVEVLGAHVHQEVRVERALRVRHEAVVDVREAVVDEASLTQIQQAAPTRQRAYRY